MKPLLAAALALAALPLVAQTSTTSTSTSSTTTTAPAVPPSAAATAPSAPGGGEGGGYAAVMQQATATLTPEEKTELQSARTKAIAADPTLQTEEMDLMQKVMAMQSGDSAGVDRQELGDEMRSHGEKVKAAMIKADPGVQPIIAKVEAQMAKLKAEYQTAH